jgi:hypothetical protein
MTKHTIPEAALAQHIAVLGKTGSGKTSTEKLAVEQVVDDGFRVCVLDAIKSDWWGITSSADGKHAGLPFRILGGPRGHVPLHSSAGKVIGQLVGSGKLPLSIIDMADFEAGGLQRFFVDFAPALMRAARGVLYLVIEEAHEFAPKERAGFGGAENMAIHWAKKLATAGRSKGIRLIVATQRVQALHNAVLGSCETLITHRLTTPADQEPVIKWLKANIDKEAVQQVAASLSSLPTGTGWVCSGEAKVFAQIKFQKFKTYDNTATPTGDDAVVDVKTAPVDQEELRSIIGDAVKEAEASDPRLLRAEISRLKVELAKKPSNVPAKTDTAPAKPAGPRREDLATINALHKALEETMKVIVKISAQDFFKAGTEGLDKAEIEKAIAGAAQSVVKLAERHLERRNAELDSLRKEAQRVAARLKGLLEQKDELTVDVAVRRNEPFTVSPGRSEAPKAPRQNVQYTGAGAALTKAERLILTALAQYPLGRSKTQVAILTGYSSNGGGFNNAMSSLRSAGRADGAGDRITITEAGLQALGNFEPLPHGDELLQHWYRQLGKAERATLEALVVVYPKGMTKEEVAARAGYEPNGGGFNNALSRLRSLELISGRGELVASEDLFG